MTPSVPLLEYPGSLRGEGGGEEGGRGEGGYAPFNRLQTLKFI